MNLIVHPTPILQTHSEKAKRGYAFLLLFMSKKPSLTEIVVTTLD